MAPPSSLSRAAIAISTDTEASKLGGLANERAEQRAWSPPRPALTRSQASALPSPVTTVSSPISVNWNLRPAEVGLAVNAKNVKSGADTPTSKLQPDQAAARPSWAGAINKPSAQAATKLPTTKLSAASKKPSGFKPFFMGIKEEKTLERPVEQGGTGWGGSRKGKEAQDPPVATTGASLAQSPATRKGKRKAEEPVRVRVTAVPEVPKTVHSWILSTYDMNQWGYTSRGAKIVGTVNAYNKLQQGLRITERMVERCLEIRDTEEADRRAAGVSGPKSEANQWECCVCDVGFDNVPEHKSRLPCGSICPLCGSYLLVLLTTAKKPKPFVKCAKCQSVKRQFKALKEARK
eukprot:TRINITY_DN15714_c0_g1_i1.p1 TRINITY_DN15714_c0_g1~~TRINITY_DN15714_c0_g1_i1.p1  ORF type:complete len:349 (+),score=38.46 TRINITY_DN15714_c0_g1_i1:535-1581(+)